MTAVALVIVGLALVIFVGGPLHRIALAIEKQNDHYGVGPAGEDDGEDGDGAGGPEAAA